MFDAIDTGPSVRGSKAENESCEQEDEDEDDNTCWTAFHRDAKVCKNGSRVLLSMLASQSMLILKW